MSNYGFTAKGTDGKVLVSSEGLTLHLHSKVLCSARIDLPHPVNGINPLATAFRNPVAYTAIFTLSGGDTTNRNTVLPFLKFNSSNTPASVIGTEFSTLSNGNTLVTILVIQQAVGSGAPSIYLFTPLSNIPVDNSLGNYGLQVYSNNSSLSFDSRYEPLKVVGTADGFFPSVCRAASNGSGYSPQLTPDQSTYLNHSTTSNFNDLLYYCPAHSYGAEKMMYEFTNTTCNGWDYFGACIGSTTNYAEGNLWYAYYKGVLTPNGNSSTKLSYVPYYYTHIRRTASSTGWAFLGLEDLFGGGAGDVNVDTNDYVNTTRNTDQPYSLLLTRSSYYD